MGPEDMFSAFGSPRCARRCSASIVFESLPLQPSPPPVHHIRLTLKEVFAHLKIHLLLHVDDLDGSKFLIGLRSDCNVQLHS